MDLAQWFCWITGVGAIVGLIAAIQQLLNHGLQPFVRAATLAVVIGAALALAYPNLQKRAGEGRTPLGLATSSSTPVGSASPGATPLTPLAASPIAPRVASRPPELLVPPLAAVNMAAITSRPVDNAFSPAEPAKVAAPTVATSPAAASPIAAGSAALPPVGSMLTSPALLDPATGNRTPLKPALVPPERASSTGGVKTLSPTPLAAQQKLFWPSDVAYCPVCSSVYSSKGPTHGVKCGHCGGTADLVSNHDCMVHRCGKCGALRQTTHIPSTFLPYVFRYYCSFCKEYHWYPN
jgi:hypothetical protein